MLALLLSFALGVSPGAESALDIATSLATRAEMHERFTRATLIQTAIVNGELETAQHWARQLAAIAPEAVDFADLRARFGELAHAVSKSESLATAARRTATMANACGACHELHAVRPDRFESQIGAPGGTDLIDRMGRHGWAADRLWEGLVGRSEAAWTAGATTLVEAPLTREELGLSADRAANLAVELSALGREATATVRWAGRAETYGRLIARCAECHGIYRDAE